MGCGRSAVLEAELRDLRARLEASERATTAAHSDATHKMEELDNRLFLLADQIESQKIALARQGTAPGAPALPVIAVTPESAPEVTEADDEADSWNRPRPVLHLEGSKPLLAATQSSALPSPNPDQSLGVVKLPPLPPAEPLKSVADPLVLYRKAYGELQANQIEQAASDFRELVRRYPRHDYADNAQYWLGETFYARHDYNSAAPIFQSVVARWPSSNKAPDALLKLAYCLLSLGDGPAGRNVLGQVAEHYPRTEAAHLAQRRLGELKAEKHP